MGIKVISELFFMTSGNQHPAFWLDSDGSLIRCKGDIASKNGLIPGAFEVVQAKKLSGIR